MHPRTDNPNSSGLDDDYVPSSQRGVIFFSTVPRDMRPQEVRLHFNRFGTIMRHKFTPFPKKERRPGASLLPLQFMHGYMEFTNVDDAKHAAEEMNGTAVVCKRRRKCFGQLWTVKFLDGFTWDTLLEEKEGTVRARRQHEAEARSHERSMNEAYRAAVLGKLRRKRLNTVKGGSQQDQEEQQPQLEGKEEERVEDALPERGARGRRRPRDNGPLAAAASVISVTEPVKKKLKRR